MTVTLDRARRFGACLASLAAAKLTPKAQTYYVATYGVDKLKVRYTSSGNLIRFSYRVTKVVLQVPVMENVMIGAFHVEGLVVEGS